MARMHNSQVAVYFAHSKRDYGTVRAHDAKNRIKKLFPKARVLDPENLPWMRMVSQLGSHAAVYDRVIAMSARVVILEHRGWIGKGVFEEARRALRAGKPVEVLRGGQLRRVRDVRVVNESDWKVRYGRVLLA